LNQQSIKEASPIYVTSLSSNHVSYTTTNTTVTAGGANPSAQSLHGANGQPIANNNQTNTSVTPRSQPPNTNHTHNHIAADNNTITILSTTPSTAVVLPQTTTAILTHQQQIAKGGNGYSIQQPVGEQLNNKNLINNINNINNNNNSNNNNINNISNNSNNNNIINNLNNYNSSVVSQQQQQTNNNNNNNLNSNNNNICGSATNYLDAKTGAEILANGHGPKREVSLS
jgi:hypothetical protein